MIIKPPIGARINWADSLARGLCFFAMPGEGWNTDLVSDNRASVEEPGGNDQGVTGIGSAWESNNTSNDGIAWPITPHIQSITNKATLMFWSELDSSANFGALLNIPRKATGWVSPFHTLSVIRDGSSTGARFLKTDTALRFVDSTTGFLDYDGSLHLWTVTWNDTVVKFYKDDAQHGADESITAGDVNFTGGPATEVVCFERSTGSTGEGTNGRNSFSGIWCRDLSLIDIQQFYSDSWKVIRHQSRFFLGGVIPSAFTGTLVGDIGQLTGNIVGQLPITGALVGDIGQLTGSIAGTNTAFLGTLVGDIGQLTGSIAGTNTAFLGTLVGDIGQLTGSIAGTNTAFLGTLVGDIGQLTGTINGTFTSSAVTGTLVGDIGQLTGNITGTNTAFLGTLVGDIGQLVGLITGNTSDFFGALDGTLGPLESTINGTVVQYIGTLVGDIGQLTGNITGTNTAFLGILVGDIGQLTGNITGTNTAFLGTLVGDIGQLQGIINGLVGPAGILIGDIGQLVGNIIGTNTVVVVRTVRVADSTRNAMMNLFDDLCNAGTGAIINIYSGVQPADANTPLSGNVLLATLAASSIMWGAAANGLIILNNVAEDTSASGTGVATFARVFTEDSGDVVFDCDAGLSGTTIILSKVAIVSGVTLGITTGSMDFTAS